MLNTVLVLLVCLATVLYVEQRLSNSAIIYEYADEAASTAHGRKLLSTGCQLACQITSGFNGKNGTNGVDGARGFNGTNGVNGVNGSNFTYAVTSFEYNNPTRTAVPSAASVYTPPMLLKARWNFNGTGYYNTNARTAAVGTATVPGSVAFTGITASSATVTIAGMYRLVYSANVSPGTSLGGLGQPTTLFAYSHVRMTPLSKGSAMVLLGSASTVTLTTTTYATLSCDIHVQLNATDTVNTPVVWYTGTNPSTTQGDTSSGSNLLVISAMSMTLHLLVV